MADVDQGRADKDEQDPTTPTIITPKSYLLSVQTHSGFRGALIDCMFPLADSSDPGLGFALIPLWHTGSLRLLCLRCRCRCRSSSSASASSCRCRCRRCSALKRHETKRPLQREDVAGLAFAQLSAVLGGGTACQNAAMKEPESHDRAMLSREVRGAAGGATMTAVPLLTDGRPEPLFSLWCLLSVHHWGITFNL